MNMQNPKAYYRLRNVPNKFINDLFIIFPEMEHVFDKKGKSLKTIDMFSMEVPTKIMKFSELFPNTIVTLLEDIVNCHYVTKFTFENGTFDIKYYEKRYN